MHRRLCIEADAMKPTISTTLAEPKGKIAAQGELIVFDLVYIGEQFNCLKRRLPEVVLFFFQHDLLILVAK